MSHTLTILSCSECADGTYTLRGRCDRCGHLVAREDITPHLDANEELSDGKTMRDGVLMTRMAVLRTDACECCGSISDAHFTVVRDGRYLPCPNDMEA